MPRRVSLYLASAAFMALWAAGAEATTKTATFDFTQLGDSTNRGAKETFVDPDTGLVLTIETLNNGVGNNQVGQSTPNLTTGEVLGVRGLGVNSGPAAEDDDITFAGQTFNFGTKVIDNDESDDGIQFSFDKAIKTLEIVVAGIGDFEFFGAEKSELDGPAGDATSYVNGSTNDRQGAGGKYGDGKDSDGNQVGNDATGAELLDGGTGSELQPVIDISLTGIDAEPGKHVIKVSDAAFAYFVLTASDDGEGYQFPAELQASLGLNTSQLVSAFVVQSVTATFVTPIPAALPLLGAGLGGLYWLRRRRAVAAS